jgi:hypothetical protein
VVKDSLGSNQPPNDGGGEQSGFVGTGELHGVVFGANVVDGELELHDSETNQPIDQRGPQLDQTNAPGRQDLRVVGGFPGRWCRSWPGLPPEQPEPWWRRGPGMSLEERIQCSTTAMETPKVASRMQ